jgi:hypothetical protein
MTGALLFEIAGWSGAVLIVAAYGLLTAGKLAAGGAAYQWLNVVGAIGVGLNGWWNGALPSVALNVIWAGIGMVALWQIRRAAG